MSNIDGRKAGRGFAIALVAALLGVVAGAGAMLWLGRDLPFAATLASPSSVVATVTGACGGKVKYYRNPMGSPDTSPVPKKDSMQMDYIPVCDDEGASEDGNVVKMSLDRVQRLGVRSEVVEERALSRTVRAFASVQYDERREAVVAPKFGGWIEKLYVNATGDVVAAGQKMFDVYSPELNVLQQEFLLSRSTQGAVPVADGRLRNLDYPEAELEKLRRGERPPRTVAVPAPEAGTVIQKMAIKGMRYQPGEVLFRIVDTSVMWVLAEVYEQDLAFVMIHPH